MSWCNENAILAQLLRLLRRLLQNQPVAPQEITTDGLRSYSAALDVLNLRHLHRPGRLRDNNRAENSHLPIRRRERKMQGFKSISSAQKFLITHAAVYNNFCVQRHFIRRDWPGSGQWLDLAKKKASLGGLGLT